MVEGKQPSAENVNQRKGALKQLLLYTVGVVVLVGGVYGISELIQMGNLYNNTPLEGLERMVQELMEQEGAEAFYSSSKAYNHPYFDSVGDKTGLRGRIENGDMVHCTAELLETVGDNLKMMFDCTVYQSTELMKSYPVLGSRFGGETHFLTIDGVAEFPKSNIQP